MNKEKLSKGYIFFTLYMKFTSEISKGIWNNKIFH